MPYLIPAILTLLALIVAGIGVRFAGKSRRPSLFKAGAFISAAGLMLLWLLPWWVISRDAAEWAMPLFVGALFVSVSVLGGGLSTMARAATGQGASRTDDLVEDFIRLNDLP